MKIFIAVNTTWNLYNFRSGLIKTLLLNGHDVIVIAPLDEYADRISKIGCRYIPLHMDNKSTNPLRDLLLLWRFFKLLRKELPDIFLAYTVKPNVYGSLAAHLLDIPVVNNIAGLGVAFSNRGILNVIVKLLYRLALSRSAIVFFQNDEDRTLFISSNLVRESIVRRLPGSGVDLDRFTPVPLPSKPTVNFLLIARILWDKGIGEYVGAARLLKERGIDMQCNLLGFMDVQNPSAISQHKMDQWVAEGVINYLGTSDNVEVEIAKSDCIVLPSFYREGTPKSLLEGAAMARPIVTTDSVGCRDVVDDGISGFLCRPKDAVDLAHKMERFTRLTPISRKIMGQRGREKIERDYDENIVISCYLDAIDQIVLERSTNLS